MDLIEFLPGNFVIAQNWRLSHYCMMKTREEYTDEIERIEREIANLTRRKERLIRRRNKLLPLEAFSLPIQATGKNAGSLRTLGLIKKILETEKIRRISVVVDAAAGKRADREEAYFDCSTVELIQRLRRQYFDERPENTIRSQLYRFRAAGLLDFDKNTKLWSWPTQNEKD